MVWPMFHKLGGFPKFYLDPFIDWSLVPKYYSIRFCGGDFDLGHVWPSS
jgi:hypothetical protein